MSVLVTGGAGYIGSHVCKALKKKGILPIAYDNLSEGHLFSVKWGPLIEGELSDRAKLEKTLKAYKPFAVLHFAAKALVKESVDNPSLYYSNNILGTLSLLEAMRSCSIDTLIFSSSCSVFGTPKTIPLKEEEEKKPINPYGKSKLMIEMVLEDYEKAYGLHSISLRYFNAAGADPDKEIGEAHRQETHLIPLLLSSTKTNPLLVYGTDFPTNDGSAIRDYIHVTDLADAHIAALFYLLKNPKTTAFNLGTGRGYSVLEVIENAKTTLKKSFPTQLAPRRTGDPPILVADNEKAKKELAWEPKLSDLSIILQTAYDWHCESNNFFSH